MTLCSVPHAGLPALWNPIPAGTRVAMTPAHASVLGSDHSPAWAFTLRTDTVLLILLPDTRATACFQLQVQRSYIPRGFPSRTVQGITRNIS